MKDNLIGLGLVMLSISVISLVVALVLLIASIKVIELRKPSRYILLGSGICLLLSARLCTAALG